MQLLLLEDVRKLGHLGDVVEVTAGYARNYLLPQRLATEPTEENIKGIEDRRRAASADRAKRMKEFTELAAKLKDVSVTIEAAANPEGTLYGSVGEKEIAAALQGQGFPVLPTQISLPGPIRTLDSRMVTLDFADELQAEVKVWVVREGGALHGDESAADQRDAAAQAGGEYGASPALERLLPQDLDAERATLGSMLQEKEAIGEVITVLRAAGGHAFARESHAQLYEVLVKIYLSEQPVDGVVIKDELQRRGLWDKLGGFDYLAGLLSAVPSALRAAHYAGIVYDKYLLRQLVGATHRVMEKALDNDLPAREVLDYADKEIFDVTERRVSGQAQELAQLIRDAFQTIQDRGRDGTFTGEPTGFRELDELTNGFQHGELIIIAGRPSMGKTALGLNMAEHLAIVERRPVVFFSLEMSRQQLAQRILCSRARVNSHLLRRGRHSDEDMRRLQQVASDLADAPLLVDDTADLTILELRARARMAARRQKIRAIFVDYLQLMRSPRSENRQVEVASISRGLKALAKDLDVPVVAMAQLNRSPEDKTRRGNKPRMSDLRESGAIEQDADVIALLHRESYYQTREARVDLASEREAAPDFNDPDENVAELIIAKQRNGPVDTIRLHFSREYTRFDNHMPGGAPAEYVPPDSPLAPF